MPRPALSSAIRPLRRRRSLAIATASAFAVGLALAVPTAMAQDDEEPTNLVVNGDFADGDTGWWVTENLTGEVADGEWCIDVPGDTLNPWDAIVGQDDLPLVTGESYELQFTARASTEVSVRALVQQPVDPWLTALEEFPAFTTEAQQFSYAFTASADWPDAQLAFQIGRNAEPWQFCLSEVALLTGAEPPVYDPDTGPRVRVNQVGYVLDAPKRATLVTESEEAVAWELHDADGALVAEGETVPHGPESTSGESVHVIDFSGVDTAGEGFTLTADEETSYPFAIGGTEAYADLAVDALSFYYPQRSGIAIEEEIAPGYGREAGHLDVAPNLGDGAVTCYGGACDYTLDVRGGWYDAGDHGKYVVNGGISVAQLLSIYERALHAPTGDAERLADGTLRIPEHGDGVPDVLDEARWELEFLLSMQVPAGQELAGMAHHKIHDENWTGLPLMPADDPEERFLEPPSTAATLNLAATAAQAARLFEPFDAEFAAQALEAAETAYAAALANPEVYAIDRGAGGGPYGDDDVTDEFYWAATELFLTTGEQAYADDVLASEHHEADVFSDGGFWWGSVAQLAKLDLALVPNELPGRDDVIAQVVAGADVYLAAQDASPWDLGYGADGFEWGSTSVVLNQLVVVGAAFDLTGDTSYRDGVFSGLDYILGRNALGNSYVTGYGSHYSKNQHSRWYANQLDPSLPNPPAGTLSGGPNSDTFSWDPVAQRWLTGCAPQACYIDDIGSWATNELTINWNASLSQVASFAADQSGVPEPSAPNCDVQYLINGQWATGFTAQVIVTNTGDAPLDGLALRWELPAGQTVTQFWSADLSQDGQIVSVSAVGGGHTLQSGRTFTFGFIGTKGEGETVAPASVVCTVS
ncbi:glycoside hydrolase family 9 protein [Glycomyces sp. NRRL B-16210]|uniref:glycoside hydrolase family 9 protein n=1 Tax=Glycomyces sp. NRRL B-16210 TaxID=1463821 RepID=UPI000AB7FDC5|nr:glycoside hydrolase family 9 protein [Glycomyces sp. NRRL B-16210]